jgi:Domain of unknown function (DUF1844)
MTTLDFLRVWIIRSGLTQKNFRTSVSNFGALLCYYFARHYLNYFCSRSQSHFMSEEQESGFKVSDRRKFNPDGSPRDTYSEPESAPAPPPPVAQAPAPPPQSAVRPEDVYSTAARQALEPEPQSFADPDPMEEEAEMTEFMQLLYSLASSTAFIHLGLIEHPATGRAEVNLQAAQQGIGMLMLLQEKTKGNLTHIEDEFFTTLLSDLQMQFVSLRKG